ncbi:hypothetical protein ARALYDRAFT_336687 [Arabidopsis lyrata subsp. lyrata]|uniref:Myb/SANT-like domain-containing protein n=1 Tax=Arabidopsis lyrata subsp. lyrata TaxID=81972 RepID=D7KMR8_ARALL|nr:hypothetical protein ARALYDRAFT_336687 [Arabidopsis lyrata subsp. lyrata]
MSSRGRSNTNSSRHRDTNAPSETTARTRQRYRWSPEQEKTLIELFDHAISMTNYTLKDPPPIGREYMVEKFNLAFNMSLSYGFFKNKLDEFKKAYKRWKELTRYTGITVDPETSTIYASDEWWMRESW